MITLLLQKCLCIELAGPERGYLVTALEASTRNLLSAALLWLHVRESGNASVSDPELVIRAQGIHRMVSENLVDRIQSYVAITILLWPGSGRSDGEGRKILDNLWARAEHPHTVHEDTLIPITAFAYAAPEPPEQSGFGPST